MLGGWGRNRGRAGRIAGASGAPSAGIQRADERAGADLPQAARGDAGDLLASQQVICTSVSGDVRCFVLLDMVFQRTM